VTERIEYFFKDSNNIRLIRHVGFSMAVVGMLVGVAAVIVAIVTQSGILGGIAAAMILLSFLLLPVTDINFPKRGWY
jgi:hypothetical protein